ncbi:MAG TPA: hypothetical protein VNX02_10010 [Steroidobacteraceae bacterium]|jgi:hypothetical protein|nr:hypothetical protein [Steroidobacteraceae bacterium]
MTPLPELAPDAMSGATAGEAPPLTAATGPFVLNLCSSSTPMALAQTELPELKRFNFFVSRRFEEGRERFRLHMGYFATLAEAEEWLNVVREIYPGAWAGEAPGRKLRERATAAAADQARHAAGPQPGVASAPRPVARAAVPTAAARPPAGPPPAVRVPVVHAAPQQPVRVAPRPAVAAAQRPQVPVAAPATRAPAAAPAVRPRPAPPVIPAAARAAPARPLPARSAPMQRPAAAAAPRPAVASRPVAASRPAPAPAARPAPPRVPPKPVFADSNVRDVLAALGETSTTGETRLMHAPVAPRSTPAPEAALSDTQVLRVLEDRRPADIESPADGQARNIPLLKPDDTGTRKALKEAVVANAPVWFAVQLQWSVQPVELEKVPPLAIFGAYTLYTVEGSREGRHWYGLRLGFFSDAISAKQVAYYVRSEFGSVAVVPVSPAERTRATEADKKAARLAVPEAPRRTEVDEFKLIDMKDEPLNLPAAARLKAPGATVRSPATKAGTPARPAPGGARSRGRVGARDRRGGPSLEETLEILGATQLTIEDDRSATLNDTGVRHLQVEVQKNSAFARLLDRLSERVKKQ